MHKETQNVSECKRSLRRCFLSFLAQKGEFCSTHITLLLLRSWSCYVLNSFGFHTHQWLEVMQYLQEHILWQAQAPKCLVSSPFFALKHVAYLFKKGHITLRIFLSAESCATCLFSSALLWDTNTLWAGKTSQCSSYFLQLKTNRLFYLYQSPVWITWNNPWSTLLLAG